MSCHQCDVADGILVENGYLMISLLFCAAFEDFEVLLFFDFLIQLEITQNEAWTRRPRFDVEHGCSHQQTQHQPELQMTGIDM